MGHPIEPLENVGFQFLSLRHRPKRPSFSIASRRSFGPVVRVVLGRTSGPRGGVAEGSRSLMAIFLPTSVPLRLGTELTGPYFRALVRSRVDSRCSDLQPKYCKADRCLVARGSRCLKTFAGSPEAVDV